MNSNSITDYPLCIMFCKNFEIENCNKCANNDEYMKNKNIEIVPANYYERIAEGGGALVDERT
jgi:hypothetical protein